MSGVIMECDVAGAPAIAAIDRKVLAVCTVAATVEGYDTQVIGYVAPVVSKLWHLPPGAFTGTFSAGLFGLMLGCMFIAPLADRMGRKWIIVGSTLAYGLLTIATVTADSLTALFWLRFATGLGLGAGLPNITATAAEFSPLRWRATAVAILYCGFGTGGFLGGLVAARMIDTYGWQSVFVFGGVASLLMVPLLAYAMPESRVGRPRAATDASPIALASLFQDGRGRLTLALWVVYFMGLTDLYLLASWLPTTISTQGISIAAASVITGLMQIGGIAGALVLGPLVDRYGPNPAMPIAYLFAAICIGLIGLTGSSVALTTVAVFGAGFGIVGCQNCNSGVGAKLYPARMRSTGIGWALGIGRIGSIVGPLIGGILLATGRDIRIIFLFSAIPALIAAAAYVVIGTPPEFLMGHREEEENVPI